LETGYIRFKPELVNYLKGIPWNKINKSHRNNYAAAVEEVLSTLDDSIKKQIRDEVETIFDQLSALRLIR
jgi:hypothetical protein